MADLFGSKASNRGIVIYESKVHEEKGIFSEAIELWCRKLGDLTQDDFKRGMEGLEKKAEDAYREGEEMWPPSYAEFRALCFPKNDRDSAAHKVLEHVLLAPIESPEDKEKRLELGRKEAARLLGMFDEPEPVKEIDNTLSKQRLQEAMEKLR
jgi:hypothetical protein